jgi:hypothetical protein
VYCTVRRRLRARAALEGAIRIAVVIAMVNDSLVERAERCGVREPDVLQVNGF